MNDTARRVFFETAKWLFQPLLVKTNLTKSKSKFFLLTCRKDLK